MARVYATAADLIAYGAPPSVTLPTGAEADRKLKRASEKVDRALLSAVYDTDTNGMPTDANITEAFKLATCAQVVYWADTGDELGTGGQWDSVSIGSVSLTRGSKSSPGSGGASAPSLAPQAWDHLVLAIDSRGFSLLPGVQLWG